MTPYRVFTGPGTAFPGFKKDVRIPDFKDGTSNTVLVVEADEQVPWTKPDDFAFNPKGPLPKLGGRPFLDRFHVAMADGSVRSMPADPNPAEFRGWITIAGLEVLDDSKLKQEKKKSEPKKSDKK